MSGALSTSPGADEDRGRALQALKVAALDAADAALAADPLDAIALFQARFKLRADAFIDAAPLSEKPVWRARIAEIGRRRVDALAPTVARVRADRRRNRMAEGDRLALEAVARDGGVDAADAAVGERAGAYRAAAAAGALDAAAAEAAASAFATAAWRALAFAAAAQGEAALARALAEPRVAAALPPSERARASSVAAASSRRAGLRDDADRTAAKAASARRAFDALRRAARGAPRGDAAQAAADCAAAGLAGAWRGAEAARARLDGARPSIWVKAADSGDPRMALAARARLRAAAVDPLAAAAAAGVIDPPPPLDWTAADIEARIAARLDQAAAARAWAARPGAPLLTRAEARAFAGLWATERDQRAYVLARIAALPGVERARIVDAFSGERPLFAACLALAGRSAAEALRALIGLDPEFGPPVPAARRAALIAATIGEAIAPDLAHGVVALAIGKWRKDVADGFAPPDEEIGAPGFAAALRGLIGPWLTPFGVPLPEPAPGATAADIEWTLRRAVLAGNRKQEPLRPRFAAAGVVALLGSDGRPHRLIDGAPDLLDLAAALQGAAR